MSCSGSGAQNTRDASPDPASAVTSALDAIRAAQADQRIGADLLGGSASAEPYGEDWLVTRPTARPLRDHDYPGDICTVPHEGPIDEVVWLVRSQDGAVAAISPSWSGVNCLPPPVN